MLKDKLKNLNIVIVTHEATTGPAHELRDFLALKLRNLLFIAHPLFSFPQARKKSSYFEKYRDGRLIKKHQAFHWQGLEWLCYLKDCFYTFFWVVFSGKKYDLFVGLGNINAFIGLILRKIGKVEKVIFYCIDYVPQRFENRLINNLYHFIDRICAQNCDAVWNLSPRMIEGREKKWQRKFPSQLVVSHGVHFNRIKRLPFNKINKKEIVYMGTILKKQGIQLVIKALSEIKKEIKDIHFTIIGTGPYEEKLKDLVKKLRLEETVVFTGYIESHQELENRLAKAAVAVALYNPKIDRFTYYADPGKVRTYLGAGLPVIITDVPYVAQEVEREKCGIVVEYKKYDIVRAIILLMKNEKALRKYRHAAVHYGEQFDWSKIFTLGLSELI